MDQCPKRRALGGWPPRQNHTIGGQVRSNKKRQKVERKQERELIASIYMRENIGELKSRDSFVTLAQSYVSSRPYLFLP